ncbi:hypothetical protein M408DRAFT_331428 [Serendipita vermifera MAFF 305830]|uniref:VWFA domain-containing protein n=1 Tax=Serendipita vermifera MAFF 305830 TaxID=933852 RepID=A0A0C3AY73_SERVB|nr:hypothetical protein M408DRAFT_331428 [Serendipita vermifera MAFF 305830]
MTLSDHCPLLNSPATSRIVSVANNRFGALVSSMYSFWTARGAAIRSGESSGVRRDAYTLIPFATTALTILASDTTSTPDQLLDIVLQPQPSVGWDNDFNDTLRTVHREMERTWSPDRTPVVIFLSDGEDRLTDKVVYDLCRKAVSLG